VAAPTLQAEGGLTVVTTGALAPTIPTHQADDILIVAWGFWGPNSTSLPDAAVPSGWTQIAQFDAPAADGKIGYFYKRAAAAGQTVSIARPSGWDTGTDTAWGGRAYVIRGCIKTGDPWDEADPTAVYSTANQPVDALTVSGAERLAIHFLVKCDDFVTAPTVSGWTAGAQVESGTGTDHSQGSFRKDNVSSDTTADASTVEAPAAGRYAFLGVSFKPPAITTIDKTHTTDALLEATVDKTHTTDGLLKGALDKAHTTDSLLKAALEKAHTTDALLIRAAIDLIHSTDALLKATADRSHGTDALLLGTISKAHTTDSFLAVAGVEVSHTTDALLKAAFDLAHTTDAMLKAARDLAHATDALLKASQEKSHTADSLLRATAEKLHTTDSLLKAATDKLHATDALLKATVSAPHTTDALLKATQDKLHTTDALLSNAQTVSKTHSTDSYLTAYVGPTPTPHHYRGSGGAGMTPPSWPKKKPETHLPTAGFFSEAQPTAVERASPYILGGALSAIAWMALDDGAVKNTAKWTAAIFARSIAGELLK